MKKILMLSAGLMLGSAGLAQSAMERTSPAWDNPADGYPACSAAITDSCIQLHERGVRARANLAMNANMDGSTMAIGGPYEPVATHANTIDMGHDGTMDHSDMAANTIHSGMGGPVEERTGYPPCDPGPGDDNCIQLYERGVTGSGN